MAIFTETLLALILAHTLQTPYRRFPKKGKHSMNDPLDLLVRLREVQLQTSQPGTLPSREPIRPMEPTTELFGNRPVMEGSAVACDVDATLLEEPPECSPLDLVR